MAVRTSQWLGRIVEARDQAEAAAVALVGVFVESALLRMHGDGPGMVLNAAALSAGTIGPRALGSGVPAIQALKEIRRTYEDRE